MRTNSVLILWAILIGALCTNFTCNPTQSFPDPGDGPYTTPGDDGEWYKLPKEGIVDGTATLFTFYKIKNIDPKEDGGTTLEIYLLEESTNQVVARARLKPQIEKFVQVTGEARLRYIRNPDDFTWYVRVYTPEGEDPPEDAEGHFRILRRSGTEKNN